MEHMPQPGDLAQIRSTADQTVDTLRDLVWIINPSHEYFTDLWWRGSNRLPRSCWPTSPTNSWNREPPDKIKLSLELRRNVPPLFKEVLNNIRKHSQANHVAIQLYCRDGNLVLEVKDNGVGFEVAKKGRAMASRTSSTALSKCGRN